MFGFRRGLVVGLSGVSCGGKTTVSKLLQASFPWANVVHQDAYFHPNESKYHVLIPQINHFNWDLKSALDLKKMEKDLAAMISLKTDSNTLSQFETEKARFFPNDHFVDKYRPDRLKINYIRARYSSIPLTIIEGHIIFNHKMFYDMCNLRFFFTLEREECLKRRQIRVYDPPNPPGYFDKCVWPLYSQRLEEIQKLPKIQYFDAKAEPLIEIYKQIFNSMTCYMDKIIDTDISKSSKKTESATATNNVSHSTISVKQNLSSPKQSTESATT